MKNKKRKTCFLCKAKKYTKYMKVSPTTPYYKGMKFECRNPEKCKARGANYKK